MCSHVECSTALAQSYQILSTTWEFAWWINLKTIVSEFGWALQINLEGDSGNKILQWKMRQSRKVYDAWPGNLWCQNKADHRHKDPPVVMVKKKKKKQTNKEITMSIIPAVLKFWSWPKWQPNVFKAIGDDNKFLPDVGPGCRESQVVVLTHDLLLARTQDLHSPSHPTLDDSQ